MCARFEKKKHIDVAAFYGFGEQSKTKKTCLKLVGPQDAGAYDAYVYVAVAIAA